MFSYTCFYLFYSRSVLRGSPSPDDSCTIKVLFPKKTLLERGALSQRTLPATKWSSFLEETSRKGLTTLLLQGSSFLEDFSGKEFPFPGKHFLQRGSLSPITLTEKRSLFLEKTSSKAVPFPRWHFRQRGPPSQTSFPAKGPLSQRTHPA